tara:strand:- start:545 stop:1492 length:948 start_codon:yes stop_codon:yes gene_type:complete
MSTETQEIIEDGSATPVVIDAVAEEDSKEETRTIVQESSEVEKSPESDQDPELESYSDNVKKRINQLTAKRKQAMEEAQAAYQYAQNAKQENDQLKSRLEQLDKGYLSEYDNRIQSQTAQARKIFKEAHEAGDSDKMAQAQEIISRLAVEQERLRVQKAKSAQDEQYKQYMAQQQQVQQQQQAQPPRPNPQEDAKLQGWLSKNQWFNSDRVMTRGAQAIHEQLVLEEGFDPATDDYYSEIDKRMRKEFPHKFQEKRSNVQTVTPASNNGRSVKSGRKKSVQLTPGQVAFANKMRIPLEKYAEEVLKIENKKQAGN